MAKKSEELKEVGAKGEVGGGGGRGAGQKKV